MGNLSGFDRLVFRGTLRAIAYAAGFFRFLNAQDVLLKEFGGYVAAVSERIKAAALAAARASGRPVQYLASPQTRKEDVARQIAAADGIQAGLICVLTCVESCNTFEVFRNRQTGRLELQPRIRKCLHHYHYWVHPQLGFMSARLQTWFPLSIQVCVNGREWLARTLDGAGLKYQRRDNCFTWLEDVGEAQRLMDGQVRTAWPELLDGIARQLNPLHDELFASCPLQYYWTVYQSEWATDVMFKSPAALAVVYPRLVRHGITTFGSADVMRFLGRAVPASGQVRVTFQGEVVSDLKSRPEGLCVRHRVNGNGLKVYDKQGSVLRVEQTLNQPEQFKVYRVKEGGRLKAWRRLRRSVADMPRRAEVGQACNERYLHALAQVENPQALGALVEAVCQPVHWQGQRVRALRPWGEDQALLAVIARGEFALNGFRNRELQAHLFKTAPGDLRERRRRSAQITRRLRQLRAHGLIKKVSRTHRYVLTQKGRTLVVALSAATQASVQQLSSLAA